MDRIILHSDINSCYASIEHALRPELDGVPLAVGGSVEDRHGIILAKDEACKRAGVKTGMALWQARQLCPEMTVIAPRMDVYLDYSARVLLSPGGALCYEVVLPEPVRGFAKGVVTDSFGKLGLIVESTDRFSFGNSLRRLKTLGTLGARTEAVAFPSWENAADCAETWCALLRGLGLACLVCPAVLALLLLRRLRKGGIREAKRLCAAGREALLELRDRGRARALARRGKDRRD